MRSLAWCLVPALALGCAGRPEEDFASASDDIVVCPRGTTVQGIDVSDYQGTIDWGAVARSGRAFGYAQVSDGLGYRDWTFARNWAGMRAAGMLRGAYQYFEVGENAVAQADLLADAVGSLGDGDLPPMLDIESGAGSAGEILGAMQAWSNRIQSRLGKKPVIYTGAWWWNPHTGGSAAFASYPLADSYYSESCPNIAAGWQSWTLWQYSSSGLVPGIGGHVDLDSFNGTLGELRAFAAGGGSPPPTVSGPCQGKEAGLWCGSELGLEMATLYRCSGGPSATAVSKCAYGCQVNPPGVNDACSPAPGPCSGKESGLWCGVELGLDQSKLYRCSGGRDASEVQQCAYGCHVNPPGVNDACSPAPRGPCTGKESGLWCGAELGLDANTLYECSGGPGAAVSAQCGYGCQVNPPGVDDECKAPTGPCSNKEPGLWCGVQLGLDQNTLYQCDGGPDATEYDQCSVGCQVNPPGTDDACKVPQGPCTNKEAGLWCGAQLGLDPTSLYSCDGTPDAYQVTTCAEGCQLMPPGTDDQCYSADCSSKDDGAYCGSDMVAGNPALLYWCAGGGVDSFSACANGCVTQPPGTNDVCR